MRVFGGGPPAHVTALAGTRHAETGVDTGAGICPGLPPAVSMPKPFDGGVVAGTYQVVVGADPYDAAYVEISIDGQLVKTDATSPYDYDWDTRQYAEGSAHTVTARAVDWAGMNSTVSASVTVTNVDTDGDGFLDGRERYMGTDPNRACPITTIGDDEPVDAWPPDFNDDTYVDQIGDISRMGPHMYSTRGQPAYDARFDLNVDGYIDIFDLTIETNLFGTTCR